MLSREDNELLCRVGPGTPMGELMRQYWIPGRRRVGSNRNSSNPSSPWASIIGCFGA